MGQHTWFYKSKDLYLKQNELYEKLDAHDEGIIYLDELELLQISTEIDKIEIDNKAKHHDLFRTSKRNEDRSYIDDTLFSKEECFDWISKNIEFVYLYDEKSREELIEFWNENPHGVITFG
jgi:hypothetical protein